MESNTSKSSSSSGSRSIASSGSKSWNGNKTSSSGSKLHKGTKSTIVKTQSTIQSDGTGHQDNNSKVSTRVDKVSTSVEIPSVPSNHLSNHHPSNHHSNHHPSNHHPSNHHSGLLSHPAIESVLRYSSLRRKTSTASSGSGNSVPTVNSSLPMSSVVTVGGVGVTSAGGSCSVAVGGASMNLIECPLCLLELPEESYPSLTISCHHRACYDCLKQYLSIEISESRINISCPECNDSFHPNDIRMILNDDSITSKYEKFMLRRVLCAEPDARWCPAPDCGYVVIASGCAGCPKLTCSRPGCNTSFCYHCKQEWHPNQTCDAARAVRARKNPGSDPGRNRNGYGTTTVIDPVTGQVHRDHPDIKPCPTCKVLIIKMDDGSCNHMTCSVCGTEFCWLCMKQISDLHYLSPSGCTFWGKKPWSRKKKIFWQLGMLVGAPVGIALIAGIAVPAIVIGIPVWVGRRLHAKLEKRSVSRKKRNILVAGGVISSVAVSPILATVAVGIGVPILLAYVYGVVPISLCRSGGCADEPSNDHPSSSSSDAIVRIDIDDETDIGNPYTHHPGIQQSAPDRLSLDTALSNKVNPSIGEVSLVMSMSASLGSGSHLDRCVTDTRGGDGESLSLNPSLNPSNIPLAGSIASVTTTPTPGHVHGPDSHSNDGLSNGAISNGAISNDGALSLSSKKRHSFSSQSGSASCAVSLSEKSTTNVPSDDAASTRALAGSVCSRGSNKSSKNSRFLRQLFN